VEPAGADEGSPDLSVRFTGENQMILAREKLLPWKEHGLCPFGHSAACEQQRRTVKMEFLS
jgi:hypothetical protein